ncbi:cyclin-dependent protein kinase inhibitor SMR1-like [Miscanthus floridulus]|uniref:cyclin-dependent protein kinase inhibitor SMR1-like n=1 Tax=Miscanthus floridulus TaxID=154761 RepID=UPI003457E24D
MSASPEFYKPAPPAFSPCSSPLLLHGAGAGAAGAVAEESAAAATMWPQEEEDYRCRTPTSGESQVKPPGTCPPAPAAPALCRKRLFEVEVFSLRLERLFWRPHPAEKKRRRVACPEPKPKKSS